MLGFLDIASEVAPRDVHINIAAQQTVLVADHAGSLRQTNGGKLANGNLRARRRSHQQTIERTQVAAIITQVADVYGVALAALDGGGDLFAADTGHNVSLNVVHGKPVACQLVAPQIEIQEISAAHALRVNAASARNMRQDVFDLLAYLLD